MVEHRVEVVGSRRSVVSLALKCLQTLNIVKKNNMHCKHTSQMDFEDGAIKLIKGFQQLLITGYGDMITISICRRREQ